MRVANENANLKNKQQTEETESLLLDFDELEEKLNSQLDEELSGLEFLEEEKKNIGNPDALGETIKNVVWEQFINQVAATAGEDFIKENNGLTLDLRNDAHIQTAENFKKGKIAKHNSTSREQLESNYDRYKNMSHKEFRKKYVDPQMDSTLKRAGDLKKDGVDTVTDIYTGRQIPTETKMSDGKNDPKVAQREHVKPSAKIYDNASLQMANSSEELADIINSPENLQGYTTAERNNRKSDNSSDEMESRDKNKHWEKADEKAEEFIKKKEKEGEERLKKEGKKSQKEEAFRMGGKALRAVVMQLLAELVKEIIGKLVKWFKTKKKSSESLIESIKEAVGSFVSKLKTHMVNAGNTLVTTIATAIWGPIVGTIKKIWTLLKQGWASLKKAIEYLKDPENRKQSTGELLLEVGKIVIAGSAAVGAIVLGEVLEKGLMTIPVLAFEIPLIGSLASILGIFMGAIIAGIIGAIAIHLIEKLLEKKRKANINAEKVEQGNKVLATQQEIQEVNEARLKVTKETVGTNIRNRHIEAATQMKEQYDQIFDDSNKRDNSKDIDELKDMLDEIAIDEI